MFLNDSSQATTSLRRTLRCAPNTTKWTVPSTAAGSGMTLLTHDFFSQTGRSASRVWHLIFMGGGFFFSAHEGSFQAETLSRQDPATAPLAVNPHPQPLGVTSRLRGSRFPQAPSPPPPRAQPGGEDGQLSAEPAPPGTSGSPTAPRSCLLSRLHPGPRRPPRFPRSGLLGTGALRPRAPASRGGLTFIAAPWAGGRGGGGTPTPPEDSSPPS